MDITQVRTVYFIGIGGIAMSATAGIAKARGFEVSGSDSLEVYEPSKTVLDTFGIPYYTGYKQSQAKDAAADMYIVSAGETEKNPEVAYLISAGIPYYSFSEFLFYLSENNIRIVVTGTHGKSTTSALLGFALEQLDDSSFMIGAVLRNTESNFHAGSGHYFVFEGDEYRAVFDDPTPKFHFYKPDILVLTNLEYDHPDVYASVEEIQSELGYLLENLPDDGIVIYNGDDARLQQLLYQSNRRNFSFGKGTENDFVIQKVAITPTHTEFVISNCLDKQSPKQELYYSHLPGGVFAYNAAAAITALRVLGFNPETVSVVLASFLGIKRRFEILGVEKGITVIDDYAHHPTAVASTLHAAREQYPQAHIWAVFEPHTFSRTQALINELSTAFRDADQVLLAPIYSAREHTGAAVVSDDQVLQAIRVHNKTTRLVTSKSQALKIIAGDAKPGDVVIVMAVGSFNRLGPELLAHLSKTL